MRGIYIMTNNETFKSGFVAMIGRPNVGKSTLLNHIIGQKVAIMSDKAQTTRNKIQGIYTDDHAQVVFIDTPGIHKPKHKLGQFMTDIASTTLNEVDLILFVINVTEKFGPGEAHIVEMLNKTNRPVFLVLNKIDQVHPDELLPIIENYKDKFPFAEMIPVSALNGNNTDTLLSQVVDYLDEGPQYYPKDQMTDHPERFIIGEMIREKALQLTREEVPHSIAVQIDRIEPHEEGALIDVDATIVVERKSQKGIIIGKQGSMLKEIGTRARHDIEAMLGSKIFLELWVKVESDWRNRQRLLKEFGFREEDY